jgi:glycosyltransferase involved in cell wall biosynthesis/ribosomal protein S18 acetylase RimI-like enzyme
VDVWLVNPYGPIPGEGWRDYRFTLVARALARRGHNVTWWTAAFSHQTKEFRSRDWASRSVDERFTIELVPTPSYSRNIGPGRLWFEGAFSRRFFRRAKSLSRPDVIIAADPPQFCGAAGRRLASHFGIPLVIDCLDLWPELFVSAAPAAVRPFVRMATLPLFALRRRNVKAADLVIAVAETYRQAITQSSSRQSMTIPIGVDVQSFAGTCHDEVTLLSVLTDSSPAQTGVSVPHARVRAIYAGSLGEAYDLDTVIDAARVLRDDPVDFVIAGRGPAENRLRDRIAGSHLKNVTLIGHVSAANLPRLYASADIALAPYIASSTVALPVKLFDYLAAGLPIITSLRGEALQLIEEAGAGLAYAAGDAASLTAVVRLLAGDRERRRAMSIAARGAAAQFDSADLYERYATAVESLVFGTDKSVCATARGSRNQNAVRSPESGATPEEGSRTALDSRDRRTPSSAFGTFSPAAAGEKGLESRSSRESELPRESESSRESEPSRESELSRAAKNPGVSSTESIEIRSMTRRDLAGVVSVHQSAFPDFFLSSLGSGFLSQFYRALVDWRDGVAIVVAVDGRIAGFAAGSTAPRTFYRRLFVRRSIAIGATLVPVIARRPSTLLRVARRAVQRTGGGTESPGAELMSLAVAPNEQHRRVGRALLDAFVARVAEARQESLWLTTDAVHNDGVKRFYERAGFVKSRTFTNSEGRQLDEYRRDF